MFFSLTNIYLSIKNKMKNYFYTLVHHKITFVNIRLKKTKN